MTQEQEQLYIFTGPAVAIIVATVFLVAWIYQRRHHYALFFAGAFFTYAIAALIQIIGIPKAPGPNTLISGSVYAFSVLLMVRGIFVRSGQSISYVIFYLILGLILFLTWYFFYVDRNLIVRIYAQNFGYGFILLLVAARMRRHETGRLIDKILFWAVLLFGVHFFIRTALTVPISEDLLRLDQLRQDGADVSLLTVLFKQSPFWQILNFSILISGFALALTFLAALAADIIEEFRREGEMDALTGLANRRAFETRADMLMCRRRAWPLTLVFCDLDHFKSVNDDFGHAAGDQVLRDFARLASRILDRPGVVARFGGEEFVLLLERQNLFSATRFAEHLRMQLAAMSFEGLDERRITASFGVAEIAPDEDLHAALKRADAACYEAKKSGRNRVCSAASTDWNGEERRAGERRFDPGI